ncbi:MAG: bis(5'-nucleosyl)-tetraphosphatase (symmetrical) YqeK [Candidatus Gastranaerophilales bacterium]|nr:bis(5'-nucleosyl)-tetraphosphatase (symmetrical) YqeK [Candidatus Gastranaerophilales bacterium]
MYTKYSIEEIKNKLKKCLSPERYNHSLGVMEKAVQLAEQFGCDVEKAQIAGLLHDCAKCISNEELKQYESYFEECEKLSFKTWHAPAGAYIAKRDYDINNEEILSSIRWHTIGKINMTVLEKIIFIADKIEERTREPEFREKIAGTLEETNSLDAAMLKSFKITIKSLLKRELPICFQTIEVYNYLLENYNKCNHNKQRFV